jgi:hypothetical protein
MTFTKQEVLEALALLDKNESLKHCKNLVMLAAPENPDEYITVYFDEYQF